MKLVIINECKSFGGAEVYTQTLSQLLRGAGHLVYNIYFQQQDIDYADCEQVCGCGSSMVNKVIFNPAYYHRLRRAITAIAPDIVILNNVFSAPLTQYLAIHGLRCVQVVHDYGIVCPKSTCITDSGEVCAGYAHENCLARCTYHGSRAVLAIKLLQLKLTAPIRKRYIAQFISPSQKLAEYAQAHGYSCTAIPNPVPLTIADEHPVAADCHRYIYIGSLNRNKGIYTLLPAFRTFAATRDVHLDLYGQASDATTRDFVESFADAKIHYHGPVTHDVIERVLAGGYALIVPSCWMENYPTTVLEGFASRILVIGSDRGGIPELLAGGRGIAYPYGEAGLVGALERAEAISDSDYARYTERGASYVAANNTPEVYLARLMQHLAK